MALLFHGLAALALLVCLAGVAGRVRFWRQGSPYRPAADDSRWRRAASAGRRAAALLRPGSLRPLFWNALLLRQVWRESRLRWLTHVCLAWSFVGLFTIGSLGNMASDLGAPLEKDDAWFAALNDALGLALLLGVALALARRYLAPGPRTRTAFDDAVVLALFALLGAGGFVLEAVRYLKEATPSGVGLYAFLGYPLSRAAEPLGWDWAAVYEGLWWSHGLLALGLVAYFPYSKLLHAVAAPLLIAVEAETAAATKPEPRPWPA